MWSVRRGDRSEAPRAGQGWGQTTQANLAPRGTTGQALAPREWLLPGGDELFRGIYTRAGIGEAETIAICSAISGEGKTTMAIGLGVTLAQDFPERRVLVVEMDTRRPILARDFEIEPYPGLIDCLAEDLPITLACRPTHLENLWLVPAGGPVAAAARWMRSPRLAAAVAGLRQQYDLVILDLPPILVSSDALPLTDLVDGVLFVVRTGVTPSALAREALAQLDDTRGRLRGVVLNGQRSALPGWLRRLFGDAGLEA